MHEKEIKNLKLYVELIANKYRGLGVPVEDLIQEGYIGIFNAKKKFDKRKNTKFNSYAIWWIKQGILNALNEQSRMVHMPFGKLNIYRKINQLKELYIKKHHREPTDSEIQEELQLKKSEHLDVANVGHQSMPIDRSITDEGDTTFENFLVFDNEIEKKVDLDDLKMALKEAMKLLTEREIIIITKFFGLGDSPKMGLEEIGQDLNLTRERCRQIKKEALTKMKKKMQLFFDEVF